MKKNYFTIIFLILLTGICFVSCRKKSKVDENKPIVRKIDYRAKGKEISDNSQNVLFTHIGDGLRKGGVPYAVEYCSLRAIPLVDSLSKINNCTISRVSAKNRNPQNNLSELSDQEVWNKFMNSVLRPEIKDTVVTQNEKVTYYRAIYIEMPTCLSCHGDPENYIEPETLAKIDELYPIDLARNYKMKELRGLWKIEFKQAE